MKDLHRARTFQSSGNRFNEINSVKPGSQFVQR